MQTDDYNEIAQFLEKSRAKYERLLQQARFFVGNLRIAEGKPRYLYVYSRADRQKNQDELKSAERIESKIKEILTKTGTTVAPNQIRDVIGLTIVTLYRDDVGKIVDIINQKCKDHSFSLHQYDDGLFFRVHQRDGYFATHLTLASSILEISDLFVEIQIKTALHDAWDRKTYNLLYRPTYKIEKKHRELLASLGNIIEQIEIQSEVVRDSCERLVAKSADNEYK